MSNSAMPETEDGKQPRDNIQKQPDPIEARTRSAPESLSESPNDPCIEDGDEKFERFSRQRKRFIVFILAFCGFLSPISSTTVLSAIPEVADTYQTTSSIINISNALYLAFMGICPLIFGPISSIFGRRWPAIISTTLFTCFSVGTALAPDLEAFFIFRALTALQGTSFFVIGSSVIGDIYRPVERSTALSWFLCGSFIGPATGPFIGGVITTFRGWRVIFWLQTALAGTAALLVIFGLPETTSYKKCDELKGLSNVQKAKQLWQWGNPIRVLRLFRVPNLIVMGFATSALVWNQYSFLTPIRYVLNVRFNLDTPLKSGLFYLAPGSGYVVGTFMGGRWADHTVKKWARKRGRRVPEDRLRSPLIFMGIISPACMLTYGWSIQTERGGIALPVVSMFIQGVAQLFCFPALNVYCIEALPDRSSDVIAGNYTVRFLFGAFGTAVVLPAIEKIGVGWFSTISAGFLVLVTAVIYITVHFGETWRSKFTSKHD